MHLVRLKESPCYDVMPLLLLIPYIAPTIALQCISAHRKAKQQLTAMVYIEHGCRNTIVVCGLTLARSLDICHLMLRCLREQSHISRKYRSGQIVC
jgi:hypothetical protein